ncbi:MAG TPA: hypothetical protein VLV78_11340 [Thermoanaerobaculia bacterium]|nr:hypothetical protein [Thermoanaerobaculia bacterium]
MKTIAALVLSAGLTCNVLGEVVAKQGPPDDDSVRFRSPMILEVPLPVSDPATWTGSRIRSMEVLSRYKCDGVSLSLLGFTADSPSHGNIRITLDAKVDAELGHDKIVSMTAQAFDGDEEIGSRGAVNGLKVEEGANSFARWSLLVIPESTLREHPKTRVRIIVHVKAN